MKAVRRKNTRYLLLILLLGVALRASTLFSVELDRDEIWSMQQSRVNLTAELNHTFHLVLVAPFTRSLPDVVGIRIVSFWAGLIAIAASARLSYRLGGWTLALWTALLVSLSPYLIAYSQEGRDYMLCVALTILGLVFWLESRPRLSAVCLLGGILALGSTVFVVLAIDIATLFAIVRSKRRDPFGRWKLPARFSVRVWLISHGLLYFATFALNWLVARSPAGAYLPVITNEEVTRFIYRYLALSQCGDGGTELLPCLSLGVILWLVLVIGVIILVLTHRLGYRGLLLLMIVIVPLAGATGLQAINYGIFVHRHLIMTLPALLGLWAIVLMFWRRWSPILGILLVAQAVLALAPYYAANPYKANWRQIGAYLSVHRQSSEPIVTESVSLEMLTDEASYNLREPITSKIPANEPFWFISLGLDDRPSDCVHVTDAGERQVFLFYCHASSSP